MTARALVSVAELSHRLDHVVALDVQWNLTSAGGPPGRELYAAAHLPGARFLDLDTDLAAAPGPAGRHPLPAPDVLESALRRCGVDAESQVVVYDQGPSFAAARAWWVLRHAGLRDVRVLDGGLSAWQRAGLPVTTELPSPAEGTVRVSLGGMPLLDADQALKCAADGVLLDARSPERFRGEQEPIDPVAGHIPGAVNAPTTDNAAADGRFLDPAELRKRFARLGVDGSTQVGVYCGSGVTAAHEVLALHEAGVQAALYVGSWSEWVTDSSRPVATG